MLNLLALLLWPASTAVPDTTVDTGGGHRVSRRIIRRLPKRRKHEEEEQEEEREEIAAVESAEDLAGLDMEPEPAPPVYVPPPVPFTVLAGPVPVEPPEALELPEMFPSAGKPPSASLQRFYAARQAEADAREQARMAAVFAQRQAEKEERERQEALARQIAEEDELILHFVQQWYATA